MHNTHHISFLNLNKNAEKYIGDVIYCLGYLISTMFIKYWTKPIQFESMIFARNTERENSRSYRTTVQTVVTSRIIFFCCKYHIPWVCYSFRNKRLNLHVVFYEKGLHTPIKFELFIFERNLLSGSVLRVFKS